MASIVEELDSRSAVRPNNHRHRAVEDFETPEVVELEPQEAREIRADHTAMREYDNALGLMLAVNAGNGLRDPLSERPQRLAAFDTNL